MSYDLRLLFQEVLIRLHQSPCTTIKELSRSLNVSTRTIERAVQLLAVRSFRRLRKESLLRRVTSEFVSHPEVAFKQVSFDVGFKSPGSFSRAIKRASGLSPKELRCSILPGLPEVQSTKPSGEHPRLKRST